MNEPNADKPKLIIDEDWKTQVQREREQLRKPHGAAQEEGAVEPQAASGAAAAEVEQPSAVKAPRGSREAGPAGGEESELPPPPPANFPLLVSMLGTQALLAMGQLGEHDPASPPRLDYAKHYIDLLGVLEEKTKNNLGTDEAHLLGDWLHQLRIAFVEMSKRAK